MTPEQQKLIQQLLHLGDVKVFNRKKETIIKAITAMDLDSLELILDENLTYQDYSITTAVYLVCCKRDFLKVIL